jgi:hypothetical protein
MIEPPVLTTPFTWRVVARRGWILALAVLVGALAGMAISRIGVSASSAFRVIAHDPRGTPYQSSRLARTYAQLLPENPAVLRAIGAVSGRSAREVRAHLAMSVRPATAIVFARYSSADARSAIAGLRALARAFAHADDGAGSRLRTTLTPLAEPRISRGFSRSRAVILGVLAGFLLGLALALALERRSPRVDDLRGLAEIVPLPVSRVSERSLPSALAALRGAGGSSARALVCPRGTPAIELEEAWRASLASGSPPHAVLLLDRTVLRRVRGGPRGVRAA